MSRPDGAAAAGMPAAGHAAGMPADVRGPLRALSGLAVLSPLFMLTPSGDAYRWLDMSGAASALVVVAGLLGLAASAGRQKVALAAGLLCLGGAAVRLVSLIMATGGPIGGSGATMTFLAGVGLGFLLLGAVGPLPARTT